ncbi:helix-turn-helix domain-containing protein [Agromyces neolithicus]|uniref:Winged helix-turn-helix transcriptional regulator n=1 Tax=Agromyces neolithicus TaxID=269420 RepID=A0ABN2M2H0_9MICO
MATRAARGFGQYSGAARALERVGDRWALLIVRDLLVGARRYGDLKAGLPRIPTNILSDRLKELQESGVIRRVPTVRGGYELTPFGRGLEPVVVALERWGWSVLGSPAEGEIVTADSLAVALRAAFRADVAAGAPPTEYVLHVGEVSVVAAVANATLEVTPIGPGALPQPRRGDRAEVAFEASAELVLSPGEFRDLISGDLDPADVQLLTGEQDAVVRFARMFHVDPVGPAPDASVGSSRNHAFGDLHDIGPNRAK